MGEDCVIGGLHVGVSTDHGRDLAIEHATHGDFFAGSFGMEVHEHDLDAEFVQTQCFVVGPDEGIFQWRLHEGTSLCLHNSDFSFVGIENDSARAGGAFRVISWTQQTWFGGEVVNDFCLIPNVVAGGDHGGTSAK